MKYYAVKFGDTIRFVRAQDSNQAKSAAFGIQDPKMVVEDLGGRRTEATSKFNAILDAQKTSYANHDA